MASTFLRTTPTSKLPVRITERDIDLGVTVYHAPQATSFQLERRHFQHLARVPGVWRPSPVTKRLLSLAEAGFLNRRRLPVASTRGGTSPYCYTLGPQGVPWVAERLDLPLELVRRHQVKAAHFSFTAFPHRHLLADTYVAFALACQAAGYSFTYTPEQELSARTLATTVAGKRVAVRPDGLAVLGHLPGGKRSALFWEIQVASDPGKWVAKARAYAGYLTSGQLERDWGYKGARVLAITTSERRAINLAQALAAQQELQRVAPVFWVTHRAAAVDDVWGAVWLAGGDTTKRYRLV